MKRVIAVGSPNMRILHTLCMEAGGDKAMFVAILEDFIQDRTHVEFKYSLEHLLGLVEHEWRTDCLMGGSSPDVQLMTNITRELEDFYEIDLFVKDIWRDLHHYAHHPRYDMVCLIMIDHSTIGIVMDDRRSEALL